MNITTVTFSSKTETYGLAAPALWQYDYGQVLKIEGLDLPTAYQVEFANSANAGQTITEVGNADGVSIPDSLLETGKNVYAFVFLHDEETDGETEYKITILVNPRPSRPNDTPTPEQQSAIDQAIAALNNAVDRTDASAEAAAGSATSAAGSAAAAAAAGSLVENLVLVQEEEPTSEDNTLWIEPGAGEMVQVPTFAEFHAATNAITDKGILQTEGTINANVSKESGTIVSKSYNRSLYASVAGVRQVTVTKNQGETFRLGFTEGVPANGVPIYGYARDDQATEITASVPQGCGYITVTYFNTNTDAGTADAMLSSITITGVIGAVDTAARAAAEEALAEAQSAGTAAEAQAAAVGELLAFQGDTVRKKASYNLFDGTLESGYIAKDGTFYAGSQKHTGKIDVHDKIGETLRAYSDDTQNIIRFVCVYDEGNTPLPALGTNDSSTEFTIPEGAFYVVLSFTASGMSSPYRLITTAPNKTIYIPPDNGWRIVGYSAVTGEVNIPRPVSLRAQSLAAGASITGTANGVKRLGSYCLYCKPGALTDDNYIIVGKDSSHGYAVGVSASKWAWFVNGVNKGEGTHGLTIKDFLLVTVDKIPGTGAVLHIYTSGGHYTRTNTSWIDDHGAPYVLNGSGDTITDVKMSWASAALRNRNWVFGDSYVTIATVRWPKCIYDLGFGENLLINGYPGAQADAGYKDFIECLNHGTPSACVWALGMNNADDGSSVNATWLKYTQAFLDVCELYDITPILATIPCCPIANHQHKNAWVRASGRRYIDFASAVNTAQDSAQWFDGMLADDNIHPTADGAIALASQVLTDFSELLVK